MFDSAFYFVFPGWLARGLGLAAAGCDSIIQAHLFNRHQPCLPLARPFAAFGAGLRAGAAGAAVATGAAGPPTSCQCQSDTSLNTSFQFVAVANGCAGGSFAETGCGGAGEVLEGATGGGVIGGGGAGGLRGGAGVGSAGAASAVGAAAAASGCCLGGASSSSASIICDTARRIPTLAKGYMSGCSATRICRKKRSISYTVSAWANTNMHVEFAHAATAIAASNVDCRRQLIASSQIDVSCAARWTR